MRVGLPAYPGATLVEPRPLAPVASAEGKQKTSTVFLTTKDSVDQVVAFYKKELGGAALVQQAEEGERKVAIIGVAGAGHARTINVVSVPETKETRITLMKSAGK